MASLVLAAGRAGAGAAGRAGAPRGRGAGDEPGPGMASARPPGRACALAPAPAGLRAGPPAVPAAAASPEPAGGAEAEERSLQHMLRAIAEERGRLSLRREVCGLGEWPAPGRAAPRVSGPAWPSRFVRPRLCASLSVSLSLRASLSVGVSTSARVSGLPACRAPLPVPAPLCLRL